MTEKETQAKKKSSATNKKVATKNSPSIAELASEPTAKTSSKPQHKHKVTHKTSATEKFTTKQKVCLTIFYVAWTLLVIYGGQYIVAGPMVALLGEKVTQPGFMLVYYLLTYSVTLFLLIIVPPQLIKIYRRQRAVRESANSEPNITKIKAADTAAAELEEDLTSTPESMGVQRWPSFVDIGLAPVGYVVYLVLANTLASIMSAFSWFQVDQEQDIGFGYFVTSADRILAMISVVLIAPIAEELIMRGWLYGKLRSKWGIVIAMFLTSIAFGFMHGQWNVAVTTFAMSIILCGLREITGTIWSGMLLHILSNAIAFYLLYVAI